MSGKYNGRSSAVRFSSSVAPDQPTGVNLQHRKLYPVVPLEDLDALQPLEIDNQPGTMSDRGQIRITQVKPALPSVNLSLPNLRDPQMMGVSMYMPSARPPSFLKDIATTSGRIGGHVSREVEQLGFDFNKFIERSDDFLHKPTALPEFNEWSVLRTLFSIAASFFDHGTDIATAYVLSDDPDSAWWFRLTVILIVIPNVFINAFSLYWYFRKDYKIARNMFKSRPAFSKCWWVTRIVVHMLLLGPIFRYIDLLYYGIQSSKSRKRRVVDIQEPKQEEELKEQVNYYNMLLHEERDISILELMHSFMQDAPQLALQIYILAKRPAVTNKSERDYIITVFVQCCSSLTSLVSLGWSLTSYQRTVRYSMPHKPQISVGGSASLFLWHAFQVASRVLALSLFANEFKLEVFIVMGAHWALMTSWILAQRTNFCGTKDGERKPCEEFFYNIVMGWVFTFAIINVKAAATRIKYTVYYILVAVENATMITLWFVQDKDQYHWYHWPALIFTFVAYVLGLFFMYLYYRHFHPDGPMPNKNETPKLF